MRGSLDWSEDERRAARRPADQSESEEKRPSDHPLAERDNATQRRVPHDK